MTFLQQIWSTLKKKKEKIDAEGDSAEVASVTFHGKFLEVITVAILC